MKPRDKIESLLRRELESHSFKCCDVLAHELIHDGEGWSTNDVWRMGNPVWVDSSVKVGETIIGHVLNRWDVFEQNYLDEGEEPSFSIDGDDKTWYLECNCKTVAELRFDEL